MFKNLKCILTYIKEITSGNIYITFIKIVLGQFLAG